jgi:predicted membrane protein
LADRELPELNFHDYLVPVLIIAVGALFIVRPRSARWNYRNRIAGEWKDKWSSNTDSWQAASSQTTSDSVDYINSTSIFSGVKRVVLSKNFMGGNITCIMGGAEIDFTQADIQGTAIIRIEQVFGGTKLIVPPHWVVNNDIDGIFHGVEDKRRMQPGSNIDTNKILILKGSSIFGGIDIRSF